MILRLVGVDRDELYALFRIELGEPNHAIFAADHIRAMIARENDNQHATVFVSVERMRAPVDARQQKIRGGLSELKGKWHDLSPISKRVMIRFYAASDRSQAECEDHATHSARDGDRVDAAAHHDRRALGS